MLASWYREEEERRTAISETVQPNKESSPRRDQSNSRQNFSPFLSILHNKVARYNSNARQFFTKSSIQSSKTMTNEFLENTNKLTHVQTELKTAERVLIDKVQPETKRSAFVQVRTKLRSDSPSVDEQADCRTPNIEEALRKMQLIVYEFDDANGMKKNLQVSSNGEVSRSHKTDNRRIVQTITYTCKHNYAICSFCVVAERIPNTENRYLVSPINVVHSKECLLNRQEATFKKIIIKIDSYNPIMLNIIKEENRKMKPKEVLSKILEQLSMEEKQFLYQDIDSSNYRRSIKKYFDNTIAKLVKKCEMA